VVTPNGEREMDILSLTTIHDRPKPDDWTSAFGNACGKLLRAIVNRMALARISPIS